MFVGIVERTICCVAAEYEVNRVYLGAVVGRTVNRITDAKFTLDDTEYQLSVNAPPNHLHGGLNGFHQVLTSHSLMLQFCSPFFTGQIVI